MTDQPAPAAAEHFDYLEPVKVTPERLDAVPEADSPRGRGRPMTARTETPAPLSPESRDHLRAHRDELHSLAGTLEVTRDELRADALLGVPIETDVLRLVRDAADLLTIAARRLDPDQEPTR